ncbi:MAG: hypothetical protein R6V15_11440, partial [Desulfotignum sp.]
MKNDGTISLGFDNKAYPAGTHMCLIYNDETERRKIISKFLEGGLKTGEKVAYFVDEISPMDMHANIKIIGRLSAAENIFHVFPSNDKIRDFSTQALKKVPGAASCSICICGQPSPSGDLLPDFCDGCDIGSPSADSDEELVCRFDGRENHDIY